MWRIIWEIAIRVGLPLAIEEYERRRKKWWQFWK